MSLGSTVSIRAPTESGGTHSGRYRVVGTGVLPTDFNVRGAGDGAMLSIAGLLGVGCGAAASPTACLVGVASKANGDLLVGMAPGAAGRADLARLGRRLANDVNYPSPPTGLVNFGQAVDFPLLFDGAVVLFALASLAHVLVVSVTRRRREVGLLKALGFVRRQVAAAVAWQALVVALVGVVVGVPLGLVAGRWLWGVFAGYFGFAAVVVVRPLSVALVAACAVAAIVALSTGPALVASRSRTAELLTPE